MSAWGWLALVLMLVSCCVAWLLVLASGRQFDEMAKLARESLGLAQRSQERNRQLLNLLDAMDDFGPLKAEVPADPIAKAERLERFADKIEESSMPDTYVIGIYRSWAKSLREGTEPQAFA